MNPFASDAEEWTRDRIAEAFGCDAVERVQWLPPGFFALPGDTRVADVDAYRDGRVTGIDVSSVAAVWALDVQPGHSVVDLCCAPGAKLCLLADALHRRGTLVGVDIASHRLRSCASLMERLGVARSGSGWSVGGCSLVRADGTKLTLDSCKNLLAKGEPTSEARAEIATGRSKKLPRKRGRRRAAEEEAKDEEDSLILDTRLLAKRRPKKLLKGSRPPTPMRATATPFWHGFSSLPPSSSSLPPVAAEDGTIPADGFDRVLVDAQCTHDGSLRHLSKYNEWGWDAFREHVLVGPEHLRELESLQRGLLRTGFRLLRPGGKLVYSTCSLTVRQNEAVVTWLLREEPTASLVPVPRFEEALSARLSVRSVAASDAERWERAVRSSVPPLSAGELPGTVRFDPLRSGTSGLFVACISKKRDE